MGCPPGELIVAERNLIQRNRNGVLAKVVGGWIKIVEQEVSFRRLSGGHLNQKWTRSRFVPNIVAFRLTAVVFLGPRQRSQAEEDRAVG